MWDNGFRQLTTLGQAGRDPDDLAGIKIRVPSASCRSACSRRSGRPRARCSSPRSIRRWTKVDGGAGEPLPIIQTAKLYEVQKYGMLTNHIWDGYLFVASGKTWSRLPEDMRKIAECAQRGRHQAARRHRRAQRLAAERVGIKGMVFSRPDPAPFREVLKKAGFYVQWREKLGEAAWTRLEKYVGKLG